MLNNIKRTVSLIMSALTVCTLALNASAATYPVSKKAVPEGSAILMGDIIGEVNGWDGSPGTGASAAFDGNKKSYYDPTMAGAETSFAGVALDDKYVLTMVCIMPREGWNDRFYGGSIQGSNDMENWYTLYESDYVPSEWTWQVITEFEANIGFRYYRYWNGQNHGDVGEIELYGYKGSTGTDPYDTSVPTSFSTVNVYFDSQGAGTSYDGLTVNVGENYPVIDYHPSKDGYLFDGWYTSADGGVKITPEVTVTYLRDHVLYARWIAKEDTVVNNDKSESLITLNDPNSDVSSPDIQSDTNSVSPAVIIVCAVIMVLSIACAVVTTVIKKKK